MLFGLSHATVFLMATLNKMAISLIYIKVSTRISFSFAFPTPTLQILFVFFTDESFTNTFLKSDLNRCDDITVGSFYQNIHLQFAKPLAFYCWLIIML